MVTWSNSDLCFHFDSCSLSLSGHCQRQGAALSYFISSTDGRKISCFLIKPYPFTGLLELVLLAPSVFLLAFFMACTGSGEGLFPLTSFGDSARRSFCYSLESTWKDLRLSLTPCLHQPELHSWALHMCAHTATHKQISTSSQKAEINLKRFCQSIEATARKGRNPPSLPCQLIQHCLKGKLGKKFVQVNVVF